MAWFMAIESFLTRIAIALITLFAGFIIAKLASRIAKKLLAEAELNRILVSAGFKPLSDALGTILEYVIYTATLLVILQQFGLTKIVLGIIAALAVIIIGISILLAFRDFVPNAIAGLFLRKKAKQHLGKKVQIGAVTGTLEKFGIISSTIRDKDEHCVPHLYTSKQKITRLRAN